MFKDILKKISGKKSSQSDGALEQTTQPNAKNPGALPGGMPGPDMSKMNALQKMAYKRFLKMSPEKQRQVLKKALTPKNIAKHRKELITQLDQAKEAGMISDDQYRLAKKKLGL